MWFPDGGRLFYWRSGSATPYEQVIATLLLQRTTAARVDEFVPAFLIRYPSWATLATVRTQELENALKPVGLWRRRAASIQALAVAMVARGGVPPTERAEVDALTGVGQYVGNAFELYYGGLQRPLIDGSVVRALQRLFNFARSRVDYRFDADVQSIALRLVQCESPREVNWALLDVANLYCLPRRPRCDECPLYRVCGHAFASMAAVATTIDRDDAEVVGKI